MVIREEITNTIIDQIFIDAVEYMTAQDRLNHEAEASEVRKLYERFLTSGLPLATFARTIRRSESWVRRRFNTWHLPIIEITAQDVELFKDAAKRRNAAALCVHDDCLPCKLLRERMAF